MQKMPVDVGPRAPRMRGKKPPPPDHIKVYKTAVFKIHNPSKHKREMLADSMKRAHFAYTRLIGHLIPDVERFARMTKKDRNAEMYYGIYRFVRPLPIGQATKAGIRIDVQGQLNSYIELRQDQEGAQIPTTSRLNEESPAYDAALAELATLGSNIARENQLRDEIARLAKSARLRPVSYYGNTRGFYLFLWDENADRYFIWLNLHAEGSRHARPVTVKNLVDTRTGEVVSFTSQTGASSPCSWVTAFTRQPSSREVARNRPELVYRAERNGQPCDDFEVHITFEWQTPKRDAVYWLGIDRGIYNLAAYAVTDGVGRPIKLGRISGRELRHVQRQEERRISGAQQRGKLIRGWTRRRAWADEAVHVACMAMQAPTLGPGENFGLRLGYGNFDTHANAVGLTAMGNICRQCYLGIDRISIDVGAGVGTSSFNTYNSGSVLGARVGGQLTWK